MNHTISAKKTALMATIMAIRRYIFVESAQNLVWQSRQRYGDLNSGCSASPDSREDRRTLTLLQFGQCRRMGLPPGSGGSRDYRASRLGGANRRNARSEPLGVPGGQRCLRIAAA
jgi:hypothetical protein